VVASLEIKKILIKNITYIKLPHCFQEQLEIPEPYLSTYIFCCIKRYTYVNKIRQKIGFFGVFLHFLVAIDIFFEERV
jgi:hypothetical protein